MTQAEEELRLLARRLRVASEGQSLRQRLEDWLTAAEAVAGVGCTCLTSESGDRQHALQFCALLTTMWHELDVPLSAGADAPALVELFSKANKHKQMRILDAFADIAEFVPRICRAAIAAEQQETARRSSDS